MRNWSGWGLLVLLALGVLGVLANLVSLRVQSGSHEVAIGFRADRHLLAGFHNQEEDSLGTRYRWTRAESRLLLRDFVAAPSPLLTLTVGGIPATAQAPRLVRLTLDDELWLVLPVAPEPRRYRLLLPPATLRDGDMTLHLASATTQVPPDRRDVGMRLDSVAVGWPTTGWALPTGRALLAQWIIGAIALAIGWRLALPRGLTLLLAGSVVVLLAWMSGADPFVAARWHYRLLVASLAVLVLVLGTYPRLVRLLPGDPADARAELRLLLLLTLGVLAVRLVGTLYPTFDAHDWYIHEDRQRLFEYGSLLLFDKPAEFSNRIAIVPPAFYVLVAPFSLLTTDTVPTTQGITAFLDGCSALLVALLVRQLGGSARAAWLALLLAAFLPIQMTALWWGFGPQVIGQALFLLLVLFVAHTAAPAAPIGHRRGRGRPPAPWFWLIAALVLTIAILTHNGVALLGGGWLALYALLSLLFQRQERVQWLGWGIVGAVSALAALLLLYSEVVALQLQGVASNERLAFTAQDIFRVKYTLGSLCASFQPLSPLCDHFLAGEAPASLLPQAIATLVSLALPLASLGWLLVSVRSPRRWLVVAWLGSAGLFFAVDLAFGLQVRYAYFVAPLVGIGLALLLDWLLGLLDRLFGWHQQVGIGWLVVAGIVGLVLFAGLQLWFEGVALGDKPSLRLLTH